MAAVSALGSTVVSRQSIGVSHRGIPNLHRISSPVKHPASLNLQGRSLGTFSSSVIKAQVASTEQVSTEATEKVDEFVFPNSLKRNAELRFRMTTRLISARIWRTMGQDMHLSV